MGGLEENIWTYGKNATLCWSKSQDEDLLNLYKPHGTEFFLTR
jgi:hypothetical protein